MEKGQSGERVGITGGRWSEWQDETYYIHDVERKGWQADDECVDAFLPSSMGIAFIKSLYRYKLVRTIKGKKGKEKKKRQQREWVNAEQAAGSDKHTRTRRRVTLHRKCRRARLGDTKHPTASASPKRVHISRSRRRWVPSRIRGVPSREAACDAMHHHSQSGGSLCTQTCTNIRCPDRFKSQDRDMGRMEGGGIGKRGCGGLSGKVEKGMGWEGEEGVRNREEKSVCEATRPHLGMEDWSTRCKIMRARKNMEGAAWMPPTETTRRERKTDKCSPSSVE
ncbi:hypothetical protein B0H13DRAFT_2172351, partial [Mycena leptocephala]